MDRPIPIFNVITNLCKNVDWDGLIVIAPYRGWSRFVTNDRKISKLGIWEVDKIVTLIIYYVVVLLKSNNYEKIKTIFYIAYLLTHFM